MRVCRSMFCWLLWFILIRGFILVVVCFSFEGSRFCSFFLYIGIYDGWFELLIWMSIYGCGYGEGYVGFDE